MKKYVGILTTLLLCTSLVACGGSSAVATTATTTEINTTVQTESKTDSVVTETKTATQDGLKGKKISVMTPYMSSVTTNQMVGYLKDGLTAKGAEVTVTDTANDFGELASRIEDVVQSGTDAIVLVSADPNQIANQLQDAFDAGIPVYGCDSGFIDGMMVNATSDNTQMGELISNYLFKDLMDSKGTVVQLTHRPHPGVVLRCEAFDKMIKDYPDISLVQEEHVPAEQPINDAQNIVQNILTAHPDKGSITAIWCGWDEPAIGATQACQEAGRDEIIVVGVDGNEQAVSLIKDGTNLKATVKQNFEGMSDIVIEQMTKQFDGEEIKPGQMYADATLITPETLK